MTFTQGLGLLIAMIAGSLLAILPLSPDSWQPALILFLSYGVGCGMVFWGLR